MTSPDWTLLFQAFADALDWALDAARDFARDFPDEVAAVERVRSFVKKRIAGDPAHVRIDDVLFAFGLVAGVVEKQLGNRIAAANHEPRPQLQPPPAGRGVAGSGARGIVSMAPAKRMPTLAARRPAMPAPTPSSLRARGRG